MKILMITLSMLFTSISFAASFEVSPMFGDHAVLQREVALPVTGRGTPGDTVTVTFAGQSRQGTVDDDGVWRVTLEPLALSTRPAEMKVTPGSGEAVVFSDILVGDVWFASGQSNMGFGYNASLKPDEPFEEEKNRDIRFFVVDPEFYPLPREVFSASTAWEVSTPAAIQWKPAVAWFFAREIRRRVDVPIGIVAVARGGTMIQPFMPIESHRNLHGTDTYPNLVRLHKELEARDPATDVGRRAYEQGLSDIRAWTADIPAYLQEGTFPSSMPSVAGDDPNTSGIYNACIHPFREFPFKGMLWYQGESNGGDNQMYYHLLKAFITTLRQELNAGDCPVYVVQLAPYGQTPQVPGAGDGSTGVRESQRLVCLDVPNTGLAVTLDIGNPRDIHPANKVDVGKRLAYWALNRDYGFEEITPSGPQYREQEIQGDRIVLRFDHVGGGLMAGVKSGLDPVQAVSDPMNLFAIAGEDKHFVQAEARIVGDTVVVSSPEVPSPRFVRYAYTSSPSGILLYNKAGLPASSFKTDSW